VTTGAGVSSGVDEVVVGGEGTGIGTKGSSGGAQT
jgi:hypothetical protein